MDSTIDYYECWRFTESVYELHQQGQKQQALDKIAAYFDEALLAHKVAQCDLALGMLDTKQLGPAMIVMVLGITGAARDYLRERPDFITRSLAALAKERGQEKAEQLIRKYV